VTVVGSDDDEGLVANAELRGVRHKPDVFGSADVDYLRAQSSNDKKRDAVGTCKFSRITPDPKTSNLRAGLASVKGVRAVRVARVQGAKRS
jgi:hypothetical protein